MATKRAVSRRAVSREKSFRSPIFNNVLREKDPTQEMENDLKEVILRPFCGLKITHFVGEDTMQSGWRHSFELLR
jgi:hypothetical protein